MNLDETKQYIDQRLNGLGWAIHIDNGWYEKIYQHTQGVEGRLAQFYYKLVSICAQKPKREINDDVVRTAIDELTKVAKNLDRTQNEMLSKNNQDLDRLSINQLASELETVVASKLKPVHKMAEPSATTAHPIKSNAQVATSTGHKAASATALPKILIVDDSHTIRVVVQKALEKYFSIIQASDGVEAWNRLLANKDIELVITDLTMPNLDGFGLINRIRSSKAFPHLIDLPIIVVTIFEDTNARARALAAGADDFIIKNSDAAELQTRVLARYKLAQTMKEAKRQPISVRKLSSGRSPDRANASVSSTAAHVASISKPSERLKVRDDLSPERVDIVIKSEIRKPEGQRQETRKSVNPVASERGQSSLGELNHRLESATSEKASWFSSSHTIIYTATLLVALMIVGIAYFNELKSTIADRLAEFSQADTPVVKARVEDDQQQKLLAPVALPGSISDPLSTSAMQKVAPDVVTEKSAVATAVVTKDENQSIKTERDESPRDEPPSKTVVSRSDKTVVPVKPVSPTQKIKLRGQTDIAAVPTKALVTRAPPTDASPRFETPNSRQPSSTSVSVETPVTTPVAQKQLTKALPSLETPNPAGVTGDDSSALLPAAAQISQQSGADDSSDAVLSRNKEDLSVATITPPPAAPNQISRTELALLIKKFVFVYEAGDINQFLSIFDEDVRTNDRTSKAGLREDYEELFGTTNLRQMVLENVTWEFSDNQAYGWGNFQVKVRKTNEEQIKAFKGSLTFHVGKRDGQLFIKHLYHGQWKVGAN